MYYESFGEYTYQDAVLEVPEASIEVYRNDAVWSQFLNITSCDVDAINAGEACMVSVFDLSGQCLYENVMPQAFDSLCSGVYIVKQGGNTKKILVK